MPVNDIHGGEISTETASLIKQMEAEAQRPEVIPNPELSGDEPALTGLQVGDDKFAVPQGTEVIANPTLAGTESDLTGLQVGETKYAVSQGTEVIANPTLAGTESDLTGLQVGETKYKIPSGGELPWYVPRLIAPILSDEVVNQITNNSMSICSIADRVVDQTSKIWEGAQDVLEDTLEKGLPDPIEAFVEVYAFPTAAILEEIYSGSFEGGSAGIVHCFATYDESTDTWSYSDIGLTRDVEPCTDGFFENALPILIFQYLDGSQPEFDPSSPCKVVVLSDEDIAQDFEITGLLT